MIFQAMFGFNHLASENVSRSFMADMSNTSFCRVGDG